jgi:hypothetical protein
VFADRTFDDMCRIANGGEITTPWGGTLRRDYPLSKVYLELYSDDRQPRFATNVVRDKEDFKIRMVVPEVSVSQHHGTDLRYLIATLKVEILSSLSKVWDLKDPSSYKDYLEDAKLLWRPLRPSVDAPDFEIRFDPTLTGKQAEQTFGALADFFRACGGTGFRVDFGKDKFQSPEVAYEGRR